MIEELLRKYSKKLSSSKDEKDKVWMKISGEMEKEQVSFFKIIFKWRFLFSFVIVLSVVTLGYLQLNQYYFFTALSESDTSVSEELAPSSKEMAGSMEESESLNTEDEFVYDEKDETNVLPVGESNLEKYIKYLCYGSIIVFTSLLVISYIREKPYHED